MDEQNDQPAGPPDPRDRPFPHQGFGGRSVWGAGQRTDRRLRWGVIAICLVFYGLSVVLSSITDSGGLASIGKFINAPNLDVMTSLGAGSLVPLLQGQLWSLVGSAYLHMDLIHLILNMIGILILMPPIQRGLGSSRTFTIYTAAGIAGSIGSALSGELYSVGASGGLFGLLGALIVMGLRQGGMQGRSYVYQGVIWAAVNFGLGLVSTMAVSNAAHAGGFVGGIAAAALLAGHDASSIVTRRTYAGSVLLTLACLAVGVGNATWQGYRSVSDKAAYDAYNQERKLAGLDAVLRWSPENMEALMQRGWARYTRNDYDAAFDDVNKALAVEPRGDAYYARASILYTQKKYDQAIADYSEAIRLNPLDLESFRYRGAAYRQKGDLTAALDDYSKVILYDPSADIYAARGDVYAADGQNDLAVKDFSEAIHLKPDNTAFYGWRGAAYTAMVNYRAAIDDYDHVIKAGDGDAQIFNNRAWALVLDGRPEEALPDAEKSLQLQPGNVAALDTRGRIYEQLGQRDKAIADYRAALAKDPNLTESRESLRRLGVEP